MTDVALRCVGLSVTLGGRRILDAVDLDVARGSWLALVGPNGAGKSTLVRCLAGLVRHEGRVELLGRTRATSSPRQRARMLAVVPQHPVIPPAVRVFDYVLLGRTPYLGLRLSPSERDREAALAVLQRLDLDGLAERPLDTLSGGERQRAVLARALVQDTDVLVLDEPTSALDVGHQFEVLELIEDLRVERGLTILTTIHDLTLAGQFADRVALLADGRVVAEGPPAEVLTAERIARHYGVVAQIRHEGGAVTVTVHRRREVAPDAAEAVPSDGGTGA